MKTDCRGQPDESSIDIEEPERPSLIEFRTARLAAVKASHGITSSNATFPCA